MLKTKFCALALVATVAFFLTTGCGNQPTHPNQINTFDGASYDSLTAAHAALASLRVKVAADFPQYAPEFNAAAATYSTAYSTYVLYRTNPNDQASVSLAIGSLSVSIIALENTFQTGMHASPQTVNQIRKRAAKLRAAAASRITISDILNELEIAALVAQSVPATQPYSTLAAVVIQATQQAIAAITSASNQPIDLSTIQPIAAIQ